MLRFHRHIVLAVLRRRAVGGGINAEDAEVTLVARPGPVVGVGAKLADAPRRTGHQAHVFVHIINEQDVLIAMVERNNFHPYIPVAFALFLQRFEVFLNLLGAGFLGHIVGYTLQHCLCNILNISKEGDRKTFVGQFLVFAAGPETVLQVIVLHGGVGLHV